MRASARVHKLFVFFDVPMLIYCLLHEKSHVITLVITCNSRHEKIQRKPVISKQKHWVHIHG